MGTMVVRNSHHPIAAKVETIGLQFIFIPTAQEGKCWTHSISAACNEQVSEF